MLSWRKLFASIVFSFSRSVTWIINYSTWWRTRGDADSLSVSLKGMRIRMINLFAVRFSCSAFLYVYRLNNNKSKALIGWGWKKNCVFQLMWNGNDKTVQGWLNIFEKAQNRHEAMSKLEVEVGSEWVEVIGDIDWKLNKFILKIKFLLRD